MRFLRPLAAPAVALGVPTRPSVAVPPLPTDFSLNHISLEYTYAELQHATRNFDECMKLGEGSYGGVYRGVLQDGTEVAIKVLDVPDEAGFEEEVKVLSKFRHPHLVILMGFARHGTQRLLVYENLAGGDLHKRIQRSCQESLPLLWHERVSIALDSACGLSHLHHSKPKVYHRDIKTPNILLDKNGTAKMADFGLACLSNANAHRVKQASGTVGYACPLYVQKGIVTEGSEVYSFGMVLLELLTASPPAYLGPGPGGSPPGAGGAGQIQYLANHINGDIRTALSLADTKAQWPGPAAGTVAELALSCIRMREERRPNFAEIVRALRALNDGASRMMNQPGLPKAPGAGAGAPGACARSLSPSASSPTPGQPPVPGHPAAQPPGSRCASTPGTRAGAGAAAARQPGRSPSPQSLSPHGVSPLSFGDAGGAYGAAAAAGSMPMMVGNRDCRSAGPRAAERQPSPGAHGAAPAAPAPAQVPAVRPLTRPLPQLLPQYAREPCIRTFRAVRVEVEAAGTLREGFAGGYAAPAPLAGVAPQGARQLFRLLCVFSEGVSLGNMPPEKRSIPHYFHVEACEQPAERGRPRLQPLRVGRVHQAMLLDSLVRGAEARSTISREHFKISGEEAQRGAGFFLENCSGNGTHVNNSHLKARGERAALHHGDLVTLSRTALCADGTAYQACFCQFRFEVTDPEASLPRCDDDETVPEYDDDEEESADGGSSLDFAPEGGIVRCGPWAPGVSDDGDMVFVLEVCGPSVRAEVPVEQRRLAYAPPPEDAEEHGSESRLYSSLIIGRAHQLDFWQEVLRGDAFNALSRQHFEVQTWRSTGGAVGVAPFSFLVRNLSDVNPVHVRAGPQETTEDPPALLQRGEQRHLLDGDEIVLNIGQEHTFWLIFRDLTASTYVPHYAANEASDDMSVNSDVSHNWPMFFKDEDEISTTATPPGGGGTIPRSEVEYDEDDYVEEFHSGQGGGGAKLPALAALHAMHPAAWAGARQPPNGVPTVMALRPGAAPRQ